MEVLLCSSASVRVLLVGERRNAACTVLDRLAVRSQTEAHSFTLGLDSPISVPDELIEQGEPARLKLRTGEAGGTPAGITLVQQLMQLSAHLHADADFFGATHLAGQRLAASAQGGIAVKVRLDVSCVAGDTLGAEAALEFAAEASLTAAIEVDGQSHQLGAICTISVIVQADSQWMQLGINALNLTLPRWRLPSLAFDNAEIQDWGLWPTINVDWLPGLGITARTDLINGEPLTARVTLEAGDLRLEVVPTGPTALLRTSLRHGEAPPIRIEIAFEKLKFVEGRIAGARLAVITPSSTLPDGDWPTKESPAAARFTWAGLRLEARWTDAQGLQLSLQFDLLRLQVSHDPSLQLAMKGSVLFTSSGITVERLELLPPYALPLIAQIVRMAADASATILRLTASAAKALLEALAALLRTAIMALEALAGGLAGLARLAGDLIRRLVDQLAGIGGQVDLELQLHITSGPFRVRRALLLYPAAARSATALGIGVSLNASARPGWLLDLPSNEPPSLHLVCWLASPNAALELWTDLWLGSETGSTALRDVDSASGNRAPQPVLQLLGEPAVGVALPILVTLAGVSADGKASFLQKLRLEQEPPPAGPLHLIDDRALTPIGTDSMTLSAKADAQRLLPFLNGPDPGPTVGPGGLDFVARLQQSVQVQRVGDAELKDGQLRLPLAILIKAFGAEVTAQLQLELELASLQARISDADAALPIRSDSIDKEALGLRWIFKPAAAEPQQEKGRLFELTLNGGAACLKLAPGASLRIRYEAASPQGRGIEFAVAGSDFSLSRTGLDLTATVALDGEPPLLNGLDLPLRLTAGRLVIHHGILTEASVSAQGRLPPKLVGDIAAEIRLQFARDGDGIVLQAAHARLGRPGAPVLCNGTRFRLTLTELGLGFVRDSGYHFYFLLTGTLEFVPNTGEFEDGLLRNLKSLRIELDQAPLAADASVLARHISFQVELSPSSKTTLFNAFGFELRSIGYLPSRDWAAGAPALRLGGQVFFLDAGDVAQTAIDFHGLEIAPPKPGASLPQIRCEGLGIDLNFGGTTRITGSVMAVDEGNTPTLFKRDGLPEGYKTYGFLGAGSIAIDGFTSLAVNLGFLEIVSPDPAATRQRAFFLYLERRQLSYRIPTPIVPIYLREVGLGFGHRYTLVGIRAAEIARSLAEMVKRLDEISRRQGELARFGAWTPDPDQPGQPPKSSLALRGAFSIASASEGEAYQAEAEAKLSNPLMFDIVAALRSDFTFLMTARGWLSLNYADFLNASQDVRTRPSFSGYLYFSAPRSEMLARVIGHRDGHIGNNPRLPPGLIAALKTTDYSATLYVRPGLFHFELGWPNQLRWQFSEGEFQLQCAGGLLMRAFEDTLVYGLNFEAQARMTFGGEMSAGCVGVSAQGSLQASIQSRFITAISLRRPAESMFYGLVAVDAVLRLAVSAWLRINLLFRKITLRASFSFEVQISAVVEVVVRPDRLGARAAVRVGLSAFGHTLNVSVALAFNTDALDDARARVQRYMSLGIGAVAAPGDQAFLPPAQAAQADQRAESEGRRNATEQLPYEKRAAPAPPPGVVAASREEDLTTFLPISNGEFVLVIRVISADQYLAMLVPAGGMSGFYAAPAIPVDQSPDADLPEAAGISAGHALLSMRTIDGIWCWAEAGWESRQLSPEGLNLPVAWNQTVAGARLWNLFLGAFGWPSSIEGQTHRIAKDPPARMMVDGHDDHEPLSVSDMAQQQLRARAIGTARSPDSEAANDVRDFIRAMMLGDFADIANEPESATSGLLLRSAGALLRLTGSALGKLVEALDANEVSVERRGVNAMGQPVVFTGALRLFNRPEFFFNKRPLAFFAIRSGRADSGIGLDWRLRWALGAEKEAGPGQYLDHYLVTRRVEAQQRVDGHKLRIKPCPTVVADEDGQLKLSPMRWQVTDRLEDCPPLLRLALNPSGSPEQAITGALAWAQLFGDKTSVSVTYTINAVDVAGTKSASQIIVARVDRPAPPLRAARGELLFEFDRLPTELPAMPVEGQAPEVPPGLNAYLKVDDPFWSEAESWHAPFEALFEVRRCYSLIVDFEDTLPVGSYGSDGATERAGGANATATNTNNRVADAAFEFDHEDCNRLRGLLAQADWDRLRRSDSQDYAALGTAVDFLPLALSRLGALATPLQLIRPMDQDRLLSLLWRGCAGLGDDGQAEHWPPVRRAARFFLRTSVEIRRRDGRCAPIVHTLPAVPVDFEMRIKRGDAVDALVPEARHHALRPAWFEWPLAAELPTLAFDDLICRSGFLARVQPRLSRTEGGPPQNPRAAQLHNAIAVRDPARRVVTELHWNALPSALWSQSDKGGATSAALSALTAAFDLYELDLDELPLGEIENSRIQPDAWARARRIGRVQLQPPASARAVPLDTSDPMAWQAVYPSEAWRTERRASTSRGPTAVRRPWLTLQEAWPVWPKAVVRRMLLPNVDDSWIDEILSQGVPQPGETLNLVLSLREWPGEAGALRPRLVFEPPVRTAASHWSLAFENYVAVSNDRRDPVSYAELRVRLTPTQTRQASAGSLALALRELLSGMAITPIPGLDGPALTSLARAWCETLTAGNLGKLNLSVKSFVLKDSKPLTIPVNLASSLHPVLADALATLRLALRQGDSPRHVVTQVLSRTSDDGGQWSRFVSETSPEADPYGWAVLHRLGLAACVRVFDASTNEPLRLDEFERPLRRCIHRALVRYQRDWFAPTAEVPAPFGQPVLDILLKPFALERLQDFDSPVSSDDPASTDVGEDSLSTFQLTLRPSLRVARIASCSFAIDALTDGATTVQASLSLTGTGVLRCRDAFAPLGSADAAVLLGDEADPVSLTLHARQEAQANRVTLHVLLHAGNGDAAQHRLTLRVGASAYEAALVPLDWHSLEASAILGNFAQMSSDNASEPSKRWREMFNEESVEPARKLFSGRRPTDSTTSPAYSGGDGSEIVPWLARFVEHAALPDARRAGMLTVALCSPQRLNPWRLAPDGQGRLRMLIAHEDRWARVRAYAVKPISRYEDLARAAGYAHCFMQSLADIDVPALRVESVAHADAVTPRTEKLLPSTFVSSSLVDEVGGVEGPVWELVLAPHPEKQLAASNRLVAARLDYRGVGLAFFRRYQYPSWLGRLTAILGAVDPYPVDAVGSLQGDATPIYDPAAAASEAVRVIPALENGGHRVALPHLPYFYRSTALAVSQAGIVVSPLARAEQREFAVTHDLGALPQPSVSATLHGERTLLCLTLSLPRHWDLVSEATRRLWMHALPAIAAVPDPELIFSVALAHRRDDGHVTLEQEIEIASTWQGLGTASHVVRAQGTVFELLADGGPAKSLALLADDAQEDAGGLRLLQIRAPLIPLGRPSTAQAVAPTPDAGDELSAELHATASSWCEAYRATRLEVSWPGAPAPSTWTAFRQWLQSNALDMQSDDVQAEAPSGAGASSINVLLKNAEIERFDGIELKSVLLQAPPVFAARRPPADDEWSELVNRVARDDARRFLQRLARQALTGGAYQELHIRCIRGSMQVPDPWVVALYPLPAEEVAP